jgi:hypothetical protein
MMVWGAVRTLKAFKAGAKLRRPSLYILSTELREKDVWTVAQIELGQLIRFTAAASTIRSRESCRRAASTAPCSSHTRLNLWRRQFQPISIKH